MRRRSRARKKSIKYRKLKGCYFAKKGVQFSAMRDVTTVNYMKLEKDIFTRNEPEDGWVQENCTLKKTTLIMLLN